MWQSYLRWRHSHGFGVHSPYAYQLVTTVIRPGDYGYYGYDRIDRLFLSPKHESGNKLRKDLYLLLRLIVNADVKRLIVFPEMQSYYKTVAKCAGISCETYISGKEKKYGQGDLLCISGEFSDCQAMESIESNNVAVIAFDPSKELREILEQPKERGLLFTGKRIIIRIPRKEMAFAAYSMKF